MFRLRQVIAAIILAIILLVAFLIAFVRSDFGGARLCDVTTAILHDVSGKEIAIGKCLVDPLNTRVAIEDVRIGPLASPMFLADKLSLGLDRSGFWRGKIRIDHVEVVRPRVALDLSTPLPPRPTEIRPPGAACLPDLGHVEIVAANLSGGELAVALPEGGSLKATGMRIHLAGEGEQLVVTFDADSSVYADPAGQTVAERAHLLGRFDLNAGTARLDAVDVSGPVGSVFLSGEMTSVCDVRGSASATLHADLGLVHNHLLHGVDNLSGIVDLSGAVTFDGHVFDATASAKIKDSTVLTFSPGSFGATFHATPEALEVQKFELPLDTGKLTATGKLILAPPFEVTANLGLENIVLGELLERLGTKDLPVEFRTTGKATLTGAAQGPDGPFFDVELDGQVPEFGVYDRSYRKRTDHGAQRYIGFHDAQLNGTIRIGNKWVDVARAHVIAKGTEFDIDGRVNFDSDEGLHLRFDSPRVQLDELGPFGPAVCKGTGRTFGTVEGPYSALVIDANMALRTLRVQGFDIGDVGAHTRIDLGKRELDVTEAKIAIANSNFSGDGRLTFDGPPLVDGRLSFDGTHLLDLVGIARAKFPSLDKLTGNVDALVTGDVEISGPAKALEMEARLSLAGISLYGQTFDYGAIRTTMREGKSLSVESLELQRGQGRLRARGELVFASQSFHAQLVSHDLDVTQMDAVMAKLPKATGGVFVRLDAEGTLKHATAHGDFMLRDAWIGVQPLATADFKLLLDGENLSASGMFQSPLPAGEEPDPNSSVAGPAPPGSMRHRVEATIKLAGDMPYGVHDEWMVPDASEVLPAGTLGEVKASGKGTLDVTGTFAALDRPNLQLNVARLAAHYKDDPDAELHSMGPINVALSDGKLTVDPFDLQGRAVKLTMGGTREADGRLDFGADGKIPLAILRVRYPNIDQAGGEMLLKLSLKGNQAHPLFLGTAQLAGVAAHIEGLPLQLTGGNGMLSFGVKGIRLEEFTARVNDRPMTVTGGLDLDSGYSPGAFQVQANLNDVPFVQDDIHMAITGDPQIGRDSADDRLKLKGNVHITRLRYTQDLDFDKQVAAKLADLRRPITPRVFEHQKDFLDLDLHLYLDDVRIDNNLFKAKIETDNDKGLVLSGTNRHPGLLGTVSVSGAIAKIRNNQFNVSSAVVNFTDPSRIYPTFDLQADAQVKDYKVFINATGTPQNPVLNLRAEPELSSSDIVMLLTVGVTSSQFAGSTAVGGAVLDAAYNASGIPDAMKKLLPKNDIIRSQEFHVSTAYNTSTGNTEPTAEIDAKVFRDDLTLQGQTSLLGHSGLSKAALDFQLRKNVDTSVQWNEDPAAPPQGDIGGDIKVHWESP